MQPAMLCCSAGSYAEPTVHQYGRDELRCDIHDEAWGRLGHYDTSQTNRLTMLFVNRLVCDIEKTKHKIN